MTTKYIEHKTPVHVIGDEHRSHPRNVHIREMWRDIIAWGSLGVLSCIALFLALKTWA